MKVAGIGFRKGTPLAALQAVLAAAEAQGGVVAAIATLPEKSTDPNLVALARDRHLPILAVAVAGVDTPTQSARITAMHGTGSVAEAAALVAAGPGARITLARISAPGGMATAAIATSSGDLA